MRILTLTLILIYAVSIGHATEIFPFVTDKGFAYYKVFGKVEKVPSHDVDTKGILEIKEGGFTRNLIWNIPQVSWCEVSARFRNVSEKAEPGFIISLSNDLGFAAQVKSKLVQTQDGVYGIATFPVSPELSKVSIWCHGAKGATIGLDQYKIRLIPTPKIEKIPETPKVKNLDVESTPYAAFIQISNYLENSQGAIIERAKESGDFEQIGKIPAGMMSYTDKNLIAGQKYQYRVKSLSHGGESSWSKIHVVTIPLWTKSSGNSSYYVDSINGNDSNTGNTPQQAWQNIKKLNYIEFAAGDKIYLSRNSKWSTALDLKGSGSAENVITIKSYGTGELPVINVENQYFAVRIKNQSHWDISELELSNRNTRKDSRTQISYGKLILKKGDPNFHVYIRNAHQNGLVVELIDFGVAENIKLHNLYIHDVEGAQNAKSNGGILVNISGHRKASRIDNLIIEKNKIENVCRSGIVFQVWPHAKRSDWFPSTKVTISQNQLRYIGGDGIVPWACEGAKILNNSVFYAANTAHEANVAIWSWSCNSTLMSGNIAAFTRKHSGNGDGQGFDVDTNNRHTTVENNISFANKGGFILICGEEDNLNSDVIVRNNLSVGDSMSTISLWNNIQNVKIYNNTFYMPDSSRAVYLFANWGKGDLDPIQMKDINFFHNLVINYTPLTIRGQQKSWNIYENQYWGNHAKQIATYGKRNIIQKPFSEESYYPNTEQLPKSELWSKFKGKWGANIPLIFKNTEKTPLP